MKRTESDSVISRGLVYRERGRIGRPGRRLGGRMERGERVRDEVGRSRHAVV